MKLQKFTVKYYAKYLDESGYSLERFIDISKLAIFLMRMQDI